MRRICITILFVAALALLAIGRQQAWGFALLGPSLNSDATWQTVSLGYNLDGFDVGAPKNIGEGYRRNAPTVYYAFDYNFATFFNSNGMNAVRSAFAVMNALTNADDLQLSQFPYDSREAFDANALYLADLKSETLGQLMEQMGLAQPVRFDWTLHDRYLPSGAVCSADPAINGEEYLVVQRNYDPVSQVYSAYVNGTLYSYNVYESCGKLGVFPDVIGGLAIDALALPYAVDVTAPTYTPVAEVNDIWQAVSGLFGSVSGGLLTGSYFTGLTYDDVGGLRYLYSTNNMAYENPAPGAALEATNSQLQLLETSDLGALLQFAQTNPPATLSAAFPNLEISGYSTYYTIVSNPIVYSYFTNYPGSPASAPPVFIIGTNGYTYTPQTNYVYSFGNMVIVHYHTNTPAKLVTVTLERANGSPASAPLETNTTIKNIVLTNVPSGDYYLIPPGSCGFDIVETLLTNNLAGITTNYIARATNSASGTSTNVIGPGFVASEYELIYSTNDWYEYYQCNFQTSGPALYQGIGKINFVEADYDSLLGQYWPPVTNYYTMVMVTNGLPIVQHFMRYVTTPDILFDAQDLASPNVAQIGYEPLTRSVTYTEDPQVPGSVLASGPGTITDYPTTISYNEVGPLYYVAGSDVAGADAFLGSQLSIFTWGSFDNSTNPPVIYPYGNLQNLANEILLQISPATLPDATDGVAYSQTFTTSGGSFTPPYTWSLGIDPSTQQQTALPTGLTLSSAGTISGTPNATPGTYDFILQMTDNNNRTVTWNYSINIHQ